MAHDGPNRRQILKRAGLAGAAAAGASAGCSAFDGETPIGASGRGATSLVLHNMTDETQRISITVTNDDPEPNIEKVPIDGTFSIDPHSANSPGEPRAGHLVYDATVQFEVSVDGGPDGTVEWVVQGGGPYLILTPGHDGTDILFAETFGVVSG